MKKQLRFLYRYLTTSRRWRRWANRQNLLIVVFSTVFLSVLSWTAPLAVVDGQHTERPAVPAAANDGKAGANLLTGANELSDALQATPLSTEPAIQVVTPTPYPPEFLENSDQTIGITLAGAVLVLIVIFGVLNFLPGSEKK